MEALSYLDMASTNLVTAMWIFFGLNPGLHSVVITDGAGCLAGEAVFTVLDPENIDLDIEVSPISCITGGVINVIATGGTGDYTYTWDPVFPDR